ncbi:hypothetical protein HELRODRAFT_89947, partial [Helobdella robusta]|uniref:Eukaryotic translation initiation factor 4 gamma 2 n=1 Tax=Helobdella robusta TaxID=6412 RepID=T1G7J4_HELRO
EHHDNIFRKVRGILNKLTPDRFDKLSLELLNVGIDSQTVLKGIIFLIIQKALNEPKYSSLYARLCQRLCEDAPNFESPKSNVTTFTKLLLNKCQDEFENRSKATEVAFERDGPLTPEEMEQSLIAKSKMLGNIKFIGELGKLEMVQEGKLPGCSSNNDASTYSGNNNVCPNPEDLECLCQILRTVGKRLDHDRAQAWMDQYFERIKTLQNMPGLPPRIKFMLQDIIELRANKWQPRKTVLPEGAPRTIQQVIRLCVCTSGIGSECMENQESIQEESGLFNTNKMPQHPNMSPSYLLSDPFFSGPPSNPQFFNDPFGGVMGTNNPGSHWLGGGTARELPPRFRKQQQQDPEMNKPSLLDRNLAKVKPSTSLEEGEHRHKPSSSSNNPMPQFHPLASASMGSRPPLLPQAGYYPPNYPPNFMRPPPFNMPPYHLPGAPSNFHPPHMVMPSRGFEGYGAGRGAPQMHLMRPNQKGHNDEEISLRPMNALAPTAAATGNVMKYPTDEDRDNMSRLIKSLHEKELFTSDQFMKSFKILLDRLSILEQDLPLAKSHLARLAAQAVCCDSVSLIDIAGPLASGNHYPMFLLCLQQLVKLESSQWLAGRFDASKINLRSMLPAELEKNDRLMEILEDRGLGFLLPLQRVQGEMWKHGVAAVGPSAAVFFKWLKENVDQKLHSDPMFVSMLVTTLIKFITMESTLKEGLDTSVAPDKQTVLKEKQLLEKYKGVLQKFLLDKIDLHVSAIYALQVFSHSMNNPKGLLLRLFSTLYDLEVIYEEAFLKWKEEVNELQPGKGQALFQVNQWLVWLEQADEDSEEED